ncbi:MAG: hypothetical protein J5940_05620 [Clostridia bacterium]|nr:hypothetical protein [Clostridia bacterium]
MSNKLKEAVISESTSPKSEDRAMGRLLIIFGIAVAAIVLLIVMKNAAVGNMTLMAWVYAYVYPWMRWVSFVLFAAAVVWLVYSRYFALRDESESLFTSGEILGCTAGFAVCLSLLYSGDNFYPALVFVIAAGVLGVLSQIVKTLFFRFTFLTCLGAGLWWLAWAQDRTFGVVALFALAAFIAAVLAALAVSDAKYPSEKEIRVPLKAEFIILAVLCAAAGVIALTAPAVMPYVIYAYPALYVATVLICTFNKR